MKEGEKGEEGEQQAWTARNRLLLATIEEPTAATLGDCLVWLEQIQRCGQINRMMKMKKKKR